MKQKAKDRLVDWAVILLFAACIAGSVYLILRVMTRWKVAGLG